nr:hypothetical protein [Tanacetum cinerariifolium]
MVAILEKGKFNSDFHPMVDFIAASPLRCNLKLRDEAGIVFIPDTELFENLTLMGYNISQHQNLTFQKDEPASPMRDVSEGETCPTESGFIADQDRATIAKSSTLPYDSAPRVTSLAVDKGSVAAKQSRDDAPIKGWSINEGEEAANSRVLFGSAIKFGVVASLVLQDEEDKGEEENTEAFET